ncbi:MAG: tripartite tricarboxylate transporter permease [Comamonadaceae bacterium]|nr:tripartite tricarboxylate transporter permease [Comamonadaceae bacterium]
MDTVTGQLRLTFGIDRAAASGFDFLIAVIGLFGIGEILLTDGGGPGVQGQAARRSTCKVVLADLEASCRSYWATSLRSSLVGCWMGITPGGATPASFMSYGMAQAACRKNGDEVRQGPRSRAWSRPRPRRTPPAPRRCCRCSRSASRARPPRRCCWAAC